MKYLKINPHYESHRKIAECLIGSPCLNERDNPFSVKDEFLLLGIHERSFVWGISNTVKTSKNGILIALDTLKLCHFMAMKNEIVCKIERHKMGFPTKGIISYIDRECFEIGISTGFLNEIALDLEKLPDGAEIVEL